MKKNVDKFIIVLCVLIFCTCCGVAFHPFENYEEFYYTKVDNTKIKKLSSSDDYNMKYEYELDCYNQNGKKKKYKFKTSRELREGAYLSLLVRFTGVNKWQEAKYDEIPKDAQKKLK